jgi:RNA polymerase sigma factor (sigma-70 family)
MDTHGATATGGATPDGWPRPALAAVKSTINVETDDRADDPAGDGAGDGNTGVNETTGAHRTPVSFDDFYRQEYRSVLGLAYVLTGNASVAEDTTQDAFTAAYRQWAAIGGYDSPAAWVRRVTCNRAASVVRRRMREAKAIVRLAHRTPTHIELDEGDAEFWRSVRALPPRQAQAVALFYLNDYSVRDIAAVLDCSEGTVKTHLSRARTAVARQLRLERVEDGDE